MNNDTVRLEAGVNIVSIGQLEEAFAVTFTHSNENSVFEWLRTLLESKPLLVTSDKGLMCTRPKA